LTALMYVPACAAQCPPKMLGYKLVGDNIDKGVKHDS